MPSALILRVNGVNLSAEVTSIKRSDELLWSESTGRSATSGTMTGSVVAAKQTYSVEWGVLTAAQYQAILDATGARGFMSFSMTVAGSVLANCTVYRGEVSGELLGVFGGEAYYSGVSVEFVER